MNNDDNKPWRRLRKKDGFSFIDFKVSEAYITIMDDEPDLLYVHGRNPEQNFDITRFVRIKNAGKRNKVLVQMIKGRYAFHPEKYFQSLQLHTADDKFQSRITQIADSIRDYVPYFNKLPARNKYYETERKTLRGLLNAAEDIKLGVLEKNLKQFFWDPYKSA